MKIKYRVWFQQVNANCFDVSAETEQEALKKAYRKWRKEYAHTVMSAIEMQKKGDNK